MSFYFDFVTGFAVGGEYIEDEEEGHAIFLYLGICQVALLW